MCQKDPSMSVNAELKPHAATPPDAIRRIAVSLDRDVESGTLRATFRVEGAIARLHLPEPAPAPPMRTDGLWQHSCFEIFLQADGADSYHEFNFASSGAWAAYRFDRARSGRSSPVMAAPHIECERELARFVMTATLSLNDLPECASAATLRAGLAAVIEDERGMLTYWALAHHSPQPDFHDPAAFRMSVPTR